MAWTVHLDIVHIVDIAPGHGPSSSMSQSTQKLPYTEFIFNLANCAQRVLHNARAASGNWLTQTTLDTSHHEHCHPSYERGGPTASYR